MKTKQRGNGQGSVYKSSNGKCWVAQVVIGFRPSRKPGGARVPIKKTKSGFTTKAAAIAACPALMTASTTTKKIRLTLQDVYDAWYQAYSPRVGASTMVCYKSAYLHFKPLHSVYIDLITARDLQECMDNCPSGKRTHENMKCIAGLLWAYAIDADIVQKDITENLFIGRHETVQREPLTDSEVETIRNVINQEPYADYIYTLCYLGFRPGEFLALKKTDLVTGDGVTYLVGGSKTDAGKGRRVPVPALVMDIVNNRLSCPDTDLLFPRYCHDRKGRPTGLKQMSDAYFRESIFKPLMQKLGIAEGKVPYCARHTYSDKLKNADGDDKTKASLMGHTDYSFTQSHYQSVSTSDLKKIAESIK